MLRFFENEAEPRWPVSGDLPEHHQLSQLLKFSGMRNVDSFLPFSSSLCTSSLGSDNGNQATGSNFFTELERLNNFSGNLVNITSQDYNSFQLAALNQLPGQTSVGQISLDLNPTGGCRVPRLTSRQHNGISESKKDKKNTRRESKRFKAAYKDKQQTPTYHELNTVAALNKAPLTGRRSQKLGDKVTALQQLVSPFGKTDTASVLQEACVYIKFLHEQIRVLSSPYFGNKASSPCFQGIGGEKLALRANGLCLVPISSIVMNLEGQESFNHHSI